MSLDINLTNVESTTNKSTNVVTDQASNTKYPSVKAVFDWANSAISWIATNGANVLSHLSNTNNPHSTTATQVDALKRDGSNANSDVDLDTFGLDAKFIKIKGTGGNGHLNLKHQSSSATAGGSESVIYADASGNPKWKNDGNAVQDVLLSGTTTADIADSTNMRYVTDRGRDIANNTWRHINSSDSLPITGTTINTIIRAVHIPANTLTSNSVLRILQNEYEKTGANNTSIRIYINTSNSLVGASLLANRINYTGLYFQLRRNFKCDGSELKGYNSSANIALESELSAILGSRTPIDVSVDNWLIFAVQLSNTSDSIIQTGLDIEICTQ